MGSGSGGREPATSATLTNFPIIICWSVYGRPGGGQAIITRDARGHKVACLRTVRVVGCNSDYQIQSRGLGLHVNKGEDLPPPRPLHYPGAGQVSPPLPPPTLTAYNNVTTLPGLNRRQLRNMYT